VVERPQREHACLCGDWIAELSRDHGHRRGFTNDFPAYFGPFGIVTFERRPKKAHDALRALWTEDAAGDAGNPRPR
jgi:hypothetical protein